jgi:hypothetical protein
MFASPVLFLVFNRPSTTKRVFEQIRRAQPSRLFVAADGPRLDRAGEAERCAEVRKIIDGVDWECEVRTLFRGDNLGCRKAVSSAIDWFFENVEEGIILEDDCLPSQSFFHFCAELLDRFRDDSRVMQISGSNYLSVTLKESYYFSKYGPIWGWATWKRAWKLYDVEMQLWPLVKQNRLHYDFCFDESEVAVREQTFDAVYAGKIDTWDYQWVFARLINSGLSITPAHNLITNIGFSDDATHTKNSEDQRNNLKNYELTLPLTHLPVMVKNADLDFEYFNTFIRPPKQDLTSRIIKYFRR